MPNILELRPRCLSRSGCTGLFVREKMACNPEHPKTGRAWYYMKMASEAERPELMAHLSSSMFGTAVPLATRQRVPFASSPAPARRSRSLRVAAQGAAEGREQRRRDVLLAASALALQSYCSKALSGDKCISTCLPCTVS